MSDSDRIEKRVVLNAPLDRVWRAISDSRQFGEWFGARFDSAFAPDAKCSGKIVGTTVDPEVAKRQQPHAGRAMTLWIERVEPMALFSFRWHPYAVEAGFDYSTEPTTLVEFRLESTAGGTILTIAESGFDAIPIARRATAFARNSEGWTLQIRLVAIYVAARS